MRFANCGRPRPVPAHTFYPSNSARILWGARAKVRAGETPAPALGTSALPGTLRAASSARWPALHPPGARAFSLVEIAMAIGVVSFAFVALLGLLPMGLQTLRAAIDSGNEARIVQAITGSVLATEFARLEALDFSTSGEVLYFDDEGNPTTDPLRQVYGVKLFVQDARLTGIESRQARRVGVAVCSKASSAWKKFLSIATADSLGREPLPPELHVRSVIMAKMDGVPGP